MKKKYFILHPAKFRLDGGAMFGIIPKPLWERGAPADSLNRIDMSLRVLFIQDGEKNILVDSGIGDYHGEKWDERFDVRSNKDPLLKILKDDFNLNPDDITDVIISHLHFDHAGGIGKSENGKHVPLFPNATLHLHKAHYDYALNPTIRDSGSFQKEFFLPVINYYHEKNQIHWCSGEEGIILEDIKFKVSHGHTPHLMHPYDDKFIYLADLVPMSNHIKLAWVMGYDMTPGITVQDKKRFFDFVIEKNLTTIFEHDPLFWGAKIAEDKHDFKAKELFRAKESGFQELNL